ncbi:MAG: hypothetical protein V1712_01170 [Patescibacteria group bacterium]
MNTFKECFDIILHGNKSDSRLAARRVRKLLYSSQTGRDKYEDIKNLINDAPNEYAKIYEEWRQENFIVAVSVLYYLHNREEEPDFLFPWFFKLLQHPNGVIRYAAVRMFSHEIGPLTVHIRFPENKSGYGAKLKSEQAESILSSLFISLYKLLSILWQPKYKRYKYINSLPTSSYKSVQMILAELEECCGQKYIEMFLKSMTL